jgi:6-phosphogluconolactonase
MRELRKLADGTAVATVAADAFLKEVACLLEAKPEIHVSITGGTLGILILAKIAEHPRRDDIAWDRVHIWWGDERFVAADSADRNANQAKDALLSQLALDPAKVHEFPAYEPTSGVSIAEQLDTAAATFAAVVEEYKDGQDQILFDITLLGMGPDGHIASLFPGHAIPAAGLSIVAEHNSPKPPPQRLTFTYEAINNSTEIWFLIGGTDKAEPTSVAFSSEPTRLPVGRVQGLEKTVWFVDEAAAEGIQ